MVFASPIFLFLFLPLTLAAYFAFPRTWRNGVLLVASLAFYAWGEARYLPLIVGSVAFNWTMGRAIGDSDRPARRRRWLAVAVAGNLAALALFKYANFAVANVNAWRRCWRRFFRLAARRCRHSAAARHFVLHLPRDLVRRRRVQAQRRRRTQHPVDFALYILLFPQLIAGPIVRWRDIAAQLAQPRPARRGLRRRRAALRAGPGQEGADRQYARPHRPTRSSALPGERTRRRRSPGSASPATRCRSTSISPATRTWRSGSVRMFGFRIPRELQLPVHRAQSITRVLAALAHLAVDLVPRLSVHPAGRQPARRAPRLRQPRHRVPAVRAVARRELDRSSLWGAVPRRCSSLPSAPASTGCCGALGRCPPSFRTPTRCSS